MSIPCDLFDDLRARGERLTIQRRMVIQALCAEQGKHLAVQEIQERLRQQGTDLTEPTVYRILQWLKDLGFVSQTDLGHTGMVYQLIGHERHHHLVCLHCGAIMNVDDSIMDGLRDTLRQEYDFETRIDHMAIFGVCPACQSGEAEP